MLFSIRIFTATLGGKNSLTKEKVFSNVAESEGQFRSTKKYLHVQSIAKGHLHFCKRPLCCFMQCKRDLFQTGKGFLDTLHSFHDVLVAGSIAHTETFGTSESITAYGGYMTYLEQIHSQVGTGVDNSVTILLAEETAALGEQIEGAFRSAH